MPAPRKWTLAEHAAIIEARARMETWEEIAPRLGVHKTTLVNYAKQAGIWTPNVTHHTEDTRSGDTDESLRDWWPLSAGHPVTWGSITAGTCLDGQEFTRSLAREARSFRAGRDSAAGDSRHT